MLPKKNLILTLLFVGVILLVAGPVAADDGPIKPLDSSDQPLNADQLLAQQLALSSPLVTRYAAGSRAEVFGAFPMDQRYPAPFAQCADGSCYQVNVYNYDANAATTAIVHLNSKTVLEAYYLPDSHPLVNKRLYGLATEIISNHPDVEAALGFRPEPYQIRLMEGNNLNTQCDGNQICAGATFLVDSGAVWVLVDLNEGELAKIWWDSRPFDMRSPLDNGPQPEIEPEDCGSTIHLERDGWKLDYLTMPTDALDVFNVTFDDGTGDAAVATSIKLVEWHAHYPGNWGYIDKTGCGGGGGGFPIYPYGDTQVVDLFTGATYIGFEVVQDFRMGNWTNDCNYRYEQRVQFYTDGRWRVVAGAYGRGCGDNMLTEATYRPVIRIDVAVAGDDNDTFAVWDGDAWVPQTIENWWLQSGPYTAEGYRYQVTDQSGAGYNIEPGQGQFGDDGTGDNAYMYLTLHHPAEGDSDLPSIGTCCNADHRQGPHNFVNGEGVDNENIVLWYVPQSETITTWAVTNGLARAQYCWTDGFQDTWPCFAGPMFVPLAGEACSNYDFDCDYVIDTTDLADVAGHWNCSIAQDGCYDPRYDPDGDGYIGIIDLMRTAGRWGCALGDACYY